MHGSLVAAEARPVCFELSTMEKAGDAVMASGTIIGAVAKGELTPAEAADLMKIVERFARVLEAADFEARIPQLEETARNDQSPR
jgi:hypothetical protein